ncbi:MAG: threonine/serine dehydratase [Bacillota bacterium]
MIEVTLKDILESAKRIGPLIRRTPLEEWEELRTLTGGQIYFKMENLQKTHSFKIRGALNRVMTLDEEDRRRGIICASAGNHAQGVALACRLFGLSALVCVPVNTPATKVEATQRYGAEVRLVGSDYDEAEAAAWEIARDTGRTFVHAFEDSMVVAGQGTVGLEILQELPEVDVVLVPAGGGGLIGGIGAACKAINPRIQVLGIQSEASPVWYRSFLEGRVTEVEIQESVAEGLSGAITEVTFDHVKRVVDGFVLVPEDEIYSAMYYALAAHHLVLEGSAAVGIAAVMGGHLNLNGKRVATVLTGGNVDISRVADVIERGRRHPGE